MEKNYISALKDWRTASNDVEDLLEAIYSHVNHSAVVVALVSHLVDCVANREECWHIAKNRGYVGNEINAFAMLGKEDEEQEINAEVNSILI